MATTDTNAPHYATLDDVVTTVIMARVTDFFGFFVYAIASALVFPRVFFPHLPAVEGALWSFTLFSLAFLARPFASLAGLWVQSKIGRAGKVTLALMLLGTSTVAIGLLPGYDNIGIWAPILLAALRVVQGLGLGGAWDGITLQLTSAAPENREGIYGMIPQLGAPIGFGVAAALFFVLTGFLSSEEFLTYGWRFAFFTVLAVNVVSLFARIRLMRADFGSEDDETLLQSASVPDLFRDEWRTIVLSAMLPLAGYALFHMMTVFPLSYALLFTGDELSQILLLQLLGAVLAVLGVITSGALADRYSRRLVLRVSSGLVVLVALTIWTLESTPAVYILFGFLVLGFAYGQSGSVVPKRFQPQYRYSGSAVAVNLSWILGAAFAPLLGLSLTVWIGLWASALYLLSGAVATFIALNLLENRLRSQSQC